VCAVFSVDARFIKFLRSALNDVIFSRIIFFIVREFSRPCGFSGIRRITYESVCRFCLAPRKEKEHFARCTECGDMFDRRSLDEVLFHCTDHKHPPDILWQKTPRSIFAVTADRG
jgi:hypothetical protein